MEWIKEWIKRILPNSKRRASSQNPDSTSSRHTTTSVSRPVSPVQETSQNQPSTVPSPTTITGKGEHVGLTRCIDRHHQPRSQSITLRFSLATGHKTNISRIQREKVCTGSWNSIQ